MRLAANLCGWSIVTSAVLAFFMATGGLAQTAQQPATPAQAQQPGKAVPPAVWIVNCENNRGKLDCRASQSIFIKSTGQRLLSVAVRVPSDTKKPVLMVQVPLGVYLPAGASLKIGQDEAKKLPYRGCDQAGCVADYAISESEIAAMTKGADLTVSAQNQNQQPAFTLTVPTTGFAAAYAKVR